MRAMILAAGRGERMGALTAHTPKPLLAVNGRYLIEYSIESLVKNNIKEIIINVCYQAEQIKAVLGDGRQYGAHIRYSEEAVALETGGGILQALPLLGDEPFIVLSCDVVTDFPLKTLPASPKKLAHLVLVDNPDFYPRGDFSILANGELSLRGDQAFTFANIGVYHQALFADCVPGKFRLGDLLKQKISALQVTGEFYQGLWHNVGTPQQLSLLSAVLDNRPVPLF